MDLAFLPGTTKPLTWDAQTMLTNALAKQCMRRLQALCLCVARGHYTLIAIPPVAAAAM